MPESKPDAGVSAARAKSPGGPFLKTALQVAAAVDAAGGYRRRETDVDGEWTMVVLEAPEAGP